MAYLLTLNYVIYYYNLWVSVLEMKNEKKQQQKSTTTTITAFQRQIKGKNIEDSLTWNIALVIKWSCVDPEGGGMDPSWKSQKYSFFSNAGPDPLEEASTPCRAIIAPFPDDGPLLVLYGSPLLPSSTKKTLSELDPLWHNFLDPRMLILTRKCHNRETIGNSPRNRATLWLEHLKLHNIKVYNKRTVSWAVRCSWTQDKNL